MSELCSPSTSRIDKFDYTHPHFNAIFIGLFLLCFFLSRHLCFASRSVLEKFRRKASEERGGVHPVREDLEEIKAYKDVFEVPENPTRETPVERWGTRGGSFGTRTLTCDSDEKLGKITTKLEELLQEKEIWCETSTDFGVKGEKVVEQQVQKPPWTSETNARVHPAPILHLHHQKPEDRDPEEETSRQNLFEKSFSGMRKDREWKRTLAYKLFEERSNGGNSTECMDSLWETYEAESKKPPERSIPKKETNTSTRTMKKKKDDDLDFEDEDDGVSDLCCLQALKVSAGKMNVGLGRPPKGIAKIFKALKGVGRLHHIGHRRPNKKNKCYNS